MAESIPMTPAELTPLRRAIGGRNGVVHQNSMTYKGLKVTEYILQIEKDKPNEFVILWVRDNRWDVMMDKGIAYPMFNEKFTTEGYIAGSLWQEGSVCAARAHVCTAFEDFYREHLKDG